MRRHLFAPPSDPAGIRDHAPAQRGWFIAFATLLAFTLVGFADDALAQTEIRRATETLKLQAIAEGDSQALSAEVIAEIGARLDSMIAKVDHRWRGITSRLAADTLAATANTLSISQDQVLAMKLSLGEKTSVELAKQIAPLPRVEQEVATAPASPAP